MENGDGRVKFGLLPPPTHPGPHAVSIFSPLILFCAPPTVPVSFAFCPSIFPISTNPFTSSNCFSIFQFFPISFHLQPTILRTLHNHFCYFLFSLFLLPCFFVFLFVFFFFLFLLISLFFSFFFLQFWWSSASRWGVSQYSKCIRIRYEDFFIDSGTKHLSS